MLNFGVTARAPMGQVVLSRANTHDSNGDVSVLAGVDRRMAANLGRYRTESEAAPRFDYDMFYHQDSEAALGTMRGAADSTAAVPGAEADGRVLDLSFRRPPSAGFEAKSNDGLVVDGEWPRAKSFSGGGGFGGGGSGGGGSELGERGSGSVRGFGVQRYEQPTTESFSNSGGRESAARRGRTGGQVRLQGQQLSPPAAGTVVGQPLGEIPAQQAEHGRRWGYAGTARPEAAAPLADYQALEGRITESREEMTAPQEDLFLLPADINSNGNKEAVEQNYFRSRRWSELKKQPDELRKYRDGSGIADQGRWFADVPPSVADEDADGLATAGKGITAAIGLDETSAVDEAFSTFSLHVSDVSFKLARAALAGGQWPEAAKIRIEEFVNAVDYGDPMPSQSEKVACVLEQSVHPFLQQRNLLRVGLRTAASGRASTTPLRLTLLLDNSGSMERPDRRQTVRRAFDLLTQQLNPTDQVTLISFARQPRLLADQVSGATSEQLVQLVADLPSEGGTNIEAALQLAFEKAQEQQVDGAQNRIVLLTDGAVNLGDADPASLARTITAMRNTGIAFDAAGISADGLNDEVLEALTRQGDGRYYLLDSVESAGEGFARQIAGALRPSAKNVKVQVEFNPRRVGRYKLLGFEKHRLEQEDFRNDSVDAAEMAAAEAGVAVYQLEVRADGEGDIGSVSVRFRDLSSGQMVENRWPIPYEAHTPRLDQSPPALRVAASAALLAAKLRGEPLGDTVDLRALSELIAGLPVQHRSTDRVQQLQGMIQQARQIGAE